MTKNKSKSNNDVIEGNTKDRKWDENTMKCRNTSCGVVPEAHTSSFQLLEKCLALYGRVMLPKPAFNICEDSWLCCEQEDVESVPARWWKVSRSILRWRVSWRKAFYERPSRPVCQFCKPWHGFNGNSSWELRSAKSFPPSFSSERGREHFLSSRDSD